VEQAGERLRPEDKTPAAAPAGWYPDWEHDSEQRWWSGSEWTDRRQPVPNPTRAVESTTNQATSRDEPNRVSSARTTVDLRNRIPAQSLIEQIIRLQTNANSRYQVDGSVRASSEDPQSWYAGAVGERRVAEILARLGSEWTVLHSVPVGTKGSDIDHVLIGPAGVYTLNTKHHRGKAAWVAGHGMMIGAQKVPYVRNAASEARRAEKLLTKASGVTVEAAGLIVLVGVTSLTVPSKPDGDDVVVGVVRDRDLLAALQSRRIYSDEQVRRIVKAAVRPETWSSVPLPAVDTAALLLKFAELDNGMKARDPRARALRPHRTTAAPAPRTRAETPAASISSRRRRRKPSALESLLQAGGFFFLAWIAYSVLAHH